MRPFLQGNKNIQESYAEKKSIFGGKRVTISPDYNFSEYTTEELYGQFKSENWNREDFSNKKKIELFQEIENREAIVHHRTPAKVHQSAGSELGGYGSGNIWIRLTDNQFEDLDTLLHESEHANQDMSYEWDVNFTKSDKTLMKIESMTACDGKTRHYNYYEKPLYSVMTSELDTNNVALEKVTGLKEYFRNEEKFRTYLTGRQNYYNEVANIIELRRDEKKTALLSTAEAAYMRDELSVSELNSIRANILYGTEYDSCEKRTLEMNETLKQYDFTNDNDLERISFDNQDYSTDREIDLKEDELLFKEETKCDLKKEKVEEIEVESAKEIEKIEAESENKVEETEVIIESEELTKTEAEDEELKEVQVEAENKELEEAKSEKQGIEGEREETEKEMEIQTEGAESVMINDIESEIVVMSEEEETSVMIDDLEMSEINFNSEDFSVSNDNGIDI